MDDAGGGQIGGAHARERCQRNHGRTSQQNQSHGQSPLLQPSNNSDIMPAVAMRQVAVGTGGARVLRFRASRIVLVARLSRTNNLENRACPQRRPKHPPGALRLHGTIARKLGIAIVSGQYAPGDLLDSEIAASEQFEVSRTAYREAVRILAAKGLVDARPKVGTRVNPAAKWALLDPDVLEWTFESEPDLALLNSLFELRNVVESAAAGMADTRRTAAHLEAMRVALDEMG